MKWLDNILMKAGIMQPFTQDDILNAENEESLREHSSAVHAVTEVILRRVQSNAILRHAIADAKVRTNSLAEFEQRIRGDI